MGMDRMRESPGNLCCLQHLMMMMIYNKNIIFILCILYIPTIQFNRTSSGKHFFTISLKKKKKKKDIFGYENNVEN